MAFSNIAAAWNALGRYADTVKLLEGAGALVRDQPHAHYNLGMAYAVLGNGPAAEREVGILQALAPDLATRLRALMAGPMPAGR
jgi:tetratricopeptide (TPR) repeat protein